MKAIDEKGKLFGIVNLIDLLVVLVLIAIVAAVGWKMVGSKVSDAVESTAPVYRYEVLCKEVDLDTCEFASTHLGGQLLNNAGLLNGYVTACEVEPNYVAGIDSEGNPVLVENPEFHNLRFTIETSVSVSANAIAVGTQELRVGKSHIVKTTELEVAGYITSMEEVAANE